MLTTRVVPLAALAVAAQAVQLEASTQGSLADLAELEGLGAETMMAQTAAEADFNDMMEKIQSVYLAETAGWYRDLDPNS